MASRRSVEARPSLATRCLLQAPDTARLLTRVMIVAAGDCRVTPWGFGGDGGHCAMGSCMGPEDGQEGSSWSCSCSAGWSPFPARGASARCTVSPVLVLLFCSLTAASSAVLLSGAASSWRAGTSTSRRAAPLVIACVLCLVADALQVSDATRVMFADTWVTVCKLSAGMLLNDVVLRQTFLRYRTVALAKAQLGSSGGPSLMGAQKMERVLRRRTAVEVSLASCFFAVALAVTVLAAETRIAAAAQFVYWSVSPACVVLFLARTTSSLLNSLDFILECGASDAVTEARIRMVQRKAVAVRRIVFASAALIVSAPLVSLVLLPYSDQWAHFVFELTVSAEFLGCALNQRTQSRISRRHAKAPPQASSVLAQKAKSRTIGMPPVRGNSAAASSSIAVSPSSFASSVVVVPPPPVNNCS